MNSPWISCKPSLAVVEQSVKPLVKKDGNLGERKGVCVNGKKGQDLMAPGLIEETQMLTHAPHAQRLIQNLIASYGRHAPVNLEGVVSLTLRQIVLVPLHTKTMINNELTLDQLYAVSGGGREERRAARQARREARRERRHFQAERRNGIFCWAWERPHPDDCPYSSNPRGE